MSVDSEMEERNMSNTALITGASSGLGEEFARIHALNGDDLILVARNEERLIKLQKELQQKHSIKVKIIVKDLSEEHAAQEIYTEVKRDGLAIEYLINNAGVGGRGVFYERPIEEDRVMLQTNIVALTELTRLFLPDLIKHNHGRILNVSSTASLVPGPLHAVYFGTKAYVNFISYALVKELEHTNVTVTTLLPGAMNTRFAQRADMTNTVLFEHATSAYEVAAKGYTAMMKGKRQVMAGVPLWQKISFKIMPFMPMKIVLDVVYCQQDNKRGVK